MRWEQLFSDLDARFEELADEAMLAELADRTRVAAGAISLAARLGGAIDQAVRIRTSAGVAVGGRLRSTGPDWVLIREGVGREVLINMRHAVVIEGLTTATAAPMNGIALRLDLRHMVRGIARDRSPVAVVVPGAAPGQSGGGTELTGTLDRVGADFVELALHAPWEPRRPTDVRGVVAVPLRSLVLVRSMPLG